MFVAGLDPCETSAFPSYFIHQFVIWMHACRDRVIIPVANHVFLIQVWRITIVVFSTRFLRYSFFCCSLFCHKPTRKTNQRNWPPPYYYYCFCMWGYRYCCFRLLLCMLLYVTALKRLWTLHSLICTWFIVNSEVNLFGIKGATSRYFELFWPSTKLPLIEGNLKIIL